MGYHRTVIWKRAGQNDLIELSWGRTKSSLWMKVPFKLTYLLLAWHIRLRTPCRGYVCWPRILRLLYILRAGWFAAADLLGRLSTDRQVAFGLSPGKLAKMLSRAFWKSQTVLTPIQFELLIALNLIFCISPKSVALGASSGEPIDLASVNSSRTFPLSQQNVATNEEGRDANNGPMSERLLFC